MAMKISAASIWLFAIYSCLAVANAFGAGIMPEWMRRYDVDQPKLESKDLKVVALVVGVSNYSFGLLPNPKNDAQAVANKFRDFGYETIDVVDPTKQQMVEAIAQFKYISSRADVSIFFYAGHGIQVNGLNYIIPADFSLKNDGVISQGDALANAIPINDIIDKNMTSRIRIVFLDACRDNPFNATNGAKSPRGLSTNSRKLSLVKASGSEPTHGNSDVGLAPIPVSDSSQTLISYATKDGMTAEDGSGNHSAYSAALLKHLDDKIDVVLMLRKVRQEVIDQTKGEQQPWDYGSLLGDRLILAK